MVSKKKPKSFVKAYSKQNYTFQNCINMYSEICFILVYYYCDLKIVYSTIWNIVADYIVLRFGKVVSYNFFYCI
jgi:hypothetical protein